MLIYLNAALVSWQTVNGRLPGVGSLGLDNAPIVDRSLTRAQRDNSEVSNGGRDNLPSHSCRCVHRHRHLGVRPQTESALCNIVQDRRQTRAFKGCSI
jgi:hypothetical protein